MEAGRRDKEREKKQVALFSLQPRPSILTASGFRTLRRRRRHVLGDAGSVNWGLDFIRALSINNNTSLVCSPSLPYQTTKDLMTISESRLTEWFERSVRP